MKIECRFAESGIEISEQGVSDDNIRNFIRKYTVSTVDDRTTLVRCELKNGYILYESSSCANPKNYSQKIGEEMCRHRIEEKIGQLLGFLYCTAKNVQY